MGKIENCFNAIECFVYNRRPSDRNLTTSEYKALENLDLLRREFGRLSAKGCLEGGVQMSVSESDKKSEIEKCLDGLHTVIDHLNSTHYNEAVEYLDSLRGEIGKLSAKYPQMGNHADDWFHRLEDFVRDCTKKKVLPGKWDLEVQDFTNFRNWCWEHWNKPVQIPTKSQMYEEEITLLKKQNELLRKTLRVILED